MKKKIIIEIEECIDCPYMWYRCCSKMDNESIETPSKGNEKLIYPIPDWCPQELNKYYEKNNNKLGE